MANVATLSLSWKSNLKIWHCYWIVKVDILLKLKSAEVHKSGYFGFWQGIVKFSFYREDLSLFTLTYLLVGKALNVFLVGKSKFKSS